MEQNNTEISKDTGDEARSQEIQNLKTYLQGRFGKMPVLPGDPRVMDSGIHEASSVAYNANCNSAFPFKREELHLTEGIDKVTLNKDESSAARVVPDTTDAFRFSMQGEDPTEGNMRRNRGWGKATRFTYTSEQVEALVAAFNINPYPTRVDRENLEYMLNLSSERIKNWFQNRRSKERRKARQNNTPLLTPLLMRDMGQAHMYTTAPLMPQFPQQYRPPTKLDQQATIHSYLQSHLPMRETAGPPPPSRDPGHVPTLRANWPLAWPAIPYHIPRPVQPSSGQAQINQHWPMWHYPEFKPHTITSEQPQPTGQEGLWMAENPTAVRPIPPGTVNPVGEYTPNQISTTHLCQSSLPAVQPESQVTWFEDQERAVDATIDEAAEESLHQDDSIYSGPTNQCDSSFRSILDNQANHSNTHANSCMQIGQNSQYVSSYSKYSPITPPLAQDLDMAPYPVYSYSQPSYGHEYGKCGQEDQQSPAADDEEEEDDGESEESEAEGTPDNTINNLSFDAAQN